MISSVADEASDVLVVRGTSGNTYLLTPDGVLPSPVPWWYYKPEIVSVLRDPPPEYWAWLTETATDL